MCFVKRLLFLVAVLLSACSGGNASENGNGNGDGPRDWGDDPPPVDVVEPGDVENVALEGSGGAQIGRLTTTEITLPFGLTNARETHQAVHYIARTHQEPEAANIKIPMRSYYAHCTNPNGVESVFVSLTLQNGETIADNVGSVFEMQYDAESGGYQRVANSVMLHGLCRQSHGVAVSSDCSRVAVLCQADPFASQSENPVADLVELYGDLAMTRDADNYDEVGDDVDRRKANPELWLLEWENEPLSMDFDGYVVSKQAGGSAGKNALKLAHVESDSQGRSSYSFASTTRVFDSGGGSHYAGALYVVDRDNWRYDMYDSGDDSGRGWSFDCITGHILQTRAIYNPFTEKYAALCTSDTTAEFAGEAPWGHTYGTVGIKEESNESGRKGYTNYFVPSNNTFTANGGGHTVVPVDANASLLVLVAPQVTPASSMDRFVDWNQSSPSYSPGMTEAETCALYAEMTGGCDINFFDYMVWEGDAADHPVFNNNTINGTQTRNPKHYSRIGLVKIAPTGRRIDGEGIHWLIGAEWDLDGESNVTIGGEIVGDGTGDTVISCNYSDPQLVDLQNGRYLLGYAKFLCSDHGYSANRHMKRSDRLRGGADVLIPQAYYLAEIDVDGNILAGPVELTTERFGDLGWGGIDEMIPLGPGKVGWFYTSTPTKEPQVDSELPSPLQRNWRMMVYESAEHP